jgi:hypothetical protein
MPKSSRRRARGWTLASLLTCLLATALFCSGLANAASPDRRAPAITAHRSDRRIELPKGFATKTMQLLGEGAVFAGGGKAFGWVLEAFGGGEELESQIAEIRDQLKEIKGTLAATLAATTQIQAQLAEGTYSGLVAQATPVTASVDKGMEDLETVALMRPEDPTKKNLADAALKFIGKNLMGKEQGELAKRISGEVGSDGLVVAASKVARTSSPFWTDRTSRQVREVLDYYQQQEERLEVLRVEYMHAHPETYSAETILKSVERTSNELVSQEKALLKPSPPPDTIADTRPNANYLYDFQAVGGKFKFQTAAARIREGACGDSCWKVAGGPTIAPLIAGWTGGSWNAWLNQQTHGSVPSLAALDSGFEGVWTEAQCPLNNEYLEKRNEVVYWCKGSYLRPSGVDEVINIHSGRSGPESLENGYILVKARPEDYWW